MTNFFAQFDEIDSKTNEIEAQGACISVQGVVGNSQEEAIDAPGTQVIK